MIVIVLRQNMASFVLRTPTCEFRFIQAGLFNIHLFTKWLFVLEQYAVGRLLFVLESGFHS